MLRTEQQSNITDWISFFAFYITFYCVTTLNPRLCVFIKSEIVCKLMNNSQQGGW